MVNVFAFFRFTRLTFVKKEHEHGDTFTFFFKPSRPLRHTAGQHGLLILPNLGVHIFSLSSAPEEDYVAVTTHVRQASRYKRWLDRMQPDAKVLFAGPVLNFFLRPRASRIVFLAQGIGITPFRSMLVHNSRLKTPHHVTLIHVAQPPHTFQKLTKGLAAARYPTSPEEFTNAVRQTLQPDALYYLSGAPAFVRATKRTLRDLKIPQRQIITDSFLGY